MKTLTLNPPLSEKFDRLVLPPTNLNYKGVDPHVLLSRPTVAIVGTRKPTPYGKRMTDLYAETLARAGVVIISGLAFGIDSIAHKATLRAGGATVAVLPSGIDTIYPTSHTQLAREITEQGCLLSEYGANHTPRKKEFLERNRIIAACADAILIPEAAERSGSLNTAMHALRMNIPVFAIPGTIGSFMSSGTNELLKQRDAHLTTSPQDILELLQQNHKFLPANKPTVQFTVTEQKIIDALIDGHTEGPLIQYETGLDTVTFQATMTMLEIKGVVSQDSAAQWHKI